eukprot:1457089-Pleurochrysis_carterae.AAC.1
MRRRAERSAARGPPLRSEERRGMDLRRRGSRQTKGKVDVRTLVELASRFSFAGHASLLLVCWSRVIVSTSLQRLCTLLPRTSMLLSIALSYLLASIFGDSSDGALWIKEQDVPALRLHARRELPNQRHVCSYKRPMLHRLRCPFP